jgi:hypothetical protein
MVFCAVQGFHGVSCSHPLLCTRQGAGWSAFHSLLSAAQQLLFFMLVTYYVDYAVALTGHSIDSSSRLRAVQPVSPPLCIKGYIMAMRFTHSRPDVSFVHDASVMSLCVLLTGWTVCGCTCQTSSC